MTLDNSKKIVLVRMIGFITTLLYVLYIFLAYFPRAFRKVMSGETLTLLTVAVTVVFLLVLLWPAIKKYRYIYFSADERTITLRWYKTGLIPGESRSIEIPAGSFAGYGITSKGRGFYHYLTLYQQVQGKRAAYPLVSITGLSKAERERIEETLKHYRSAC